ncbi:hypothetical protein JCM11251_006720 [Rhodosporidiobolus azoricus]
MHFKSIFLLGLAALAVADTGSDRMVKIKRTQDAIAADAAMAKRSAPAENLARRSGAARMDKRHHGDAGAHAEMAKRAMEEVDKRELPLFQGLLSLLNQAYPGLNTALYGVQSTLNGAVNGLDGILKRDNIEASFHFHPFLMTMTDPGVHSSPRFRSGSSLSSRDCCPC